MLQTTVVYQQVAAWEGYHAFAPFLRPGQDTLDVREPAGDSSLVVRRWSVNRVVNNFVNADEAGNTYCVYGP